MMRYRNELEPKIAIYYFLIPGLTLILLYLLTNFIGFYWLLKIIVLLVPFLLIMYNLNRVIFYVGYENKIFYITKGYNYLLGKDIIIESKKIKLTDHHIVFNNHSYLYHNDSFNKLLMKLE